MENCHFAPNRWLAQLIDLILGVDRVVLPFAPTPRIRTLRKSFASVLANFRETLVALCRQCGGKRGQNEQDRCTLSQTQHR